MLYSAHNAGLPGLKSSFTITVDDETMTWVSSPPGHDLEKPMLGVYMSRGGPRAQERHSICFPAVAPRFLRRLTPSAITCSVAPWFGDV